jgi:hypothetical protein
MKRYGFIMPMMLIFLLLATLLISVVTVRISARIRNVATNIKNRESLESSRRGMKCAENWLMTSLALGNGDIHPSAELSLSAAGVWSGLCASDDVSLHVVQTDYADDGHTPAGIHGVPRIPDMEGENGRLRHYFLRSAAKSRDGLEIVSEELLAVSMDRSGTVLGVTRLFHRSRAE